MTSLLRTLLALVLFIAGQRSIAGEELIATAVTADGNPVSYILDSASPMPRYLLILFPGGNGIVDPHLENGVLVYGKKGNFLLRARKHLVDGEFATVTTNSTQAEERVQALIDDLKRRFPMAAIYLMGTSNGTHDTMRLAPYLSERIAGEIHTSSLRQIASFDSRAYKNRHLIVHHKNDECRVTPFAAAETAHERYGTAFIAMTGGISVGDPCEAFSHHGYNGIERETSEAIKHWIRQGDAR